MGPTMVSRSFDTRKLVLVIALGMSFGYLGALATTYTSHIWILDAQGHPVVEDFVAFWSVGRQALHGMAAAAYNVRLEHAAEVATVGHPFTSKLGWSYPPVFLFAAAALACLPYTLAFLLWSLTTLAAYASVVAKIVARPIAFFVACAAPWVLTGLMPGQNGFLTAALAGAVLLSLQRRPALAGICLGLLSYKPQFGILFPIALAFGGYWRAFAWACVGTLAVNALAGGVFGFGTWSGFLHALPNAAHSHLGHGAVGWQKLQSIYGFLGSLGAPGKVAWLAQVAFSIAVATIVALCWRSSVSVELKAAILAAAIPMATPYVFVYDLPVLAIACAFLFKHARFDRVELWLLAATAPCIFAFLWIPFPSAFFASLIVAAVALRRALADSESFRLLLGGSQRSWARTL